MNYSTYKIVVALSIPVLESFIEAQLKKLTTVRHKLVICDDLYTLPDLLKQETPDLVITSPWVVSDMLLPYLKERCGITDAKFVAVTAPVGEDTLLRHYNGRFDVHDREANILSLVERLINEVVEEPEENKETALTPREKDIIVCVVKGMTNKEIATTLFLSTHTVITHRRNIAKKLQIHSPAGLTIYAIVNNLVELSDIKEG